MKQVDTGYVLFFTTTKDFLGDDGEGACCLSEAMIFEEETLANKEKQNCDYPEDVVVWEVRRIVETV